LNNRATLGRANTSTENKLPETFGYVEGSFYLCAIIKPPKKNIMAKFTLQENQYIPYGAKTTPSGFPVASTYYYFTNEDGKTVDKKTLKPYRGKQLNRYAFFNKGQAEAFLEKINEG